MKHLTLFLSICWIFWFSQIFAISTICGLSDVPAASVISLGSNASEFVGNKFDSSDEYLSVFLSENNNNNSSSSSTSSIIKTENQNSENNDFIVVSEISSKVESNQNVLSENIFENNSDDKNNKENSIEASNIEENVEVNQEYIKEPPVLKEVLEEQIILSDINQLPSSSQDAINASETETVNLTVEENPIPVFSEWAQKQMEEAEKKLEKQVVNSSSSKKNATKGNKLTPIKLRVKNYASPDCGAKITASNAEAQNTGALLSSSKDEYMLSPCTSRIWFVIELCEAIQLEKVELANFELFSSSPKNFSVAVSNRFPTREWSNVGRFIAEDNRNIQSFDLDPHLFGKFIRVDVHSHYNSEHFCPISLFHVYGTSEFEAFETENRQHTDTDIDDEYDDDFSTSNDPTISTINNNNLKNNENNLFKSASDAVMSIVKKAAEVLVKTNLNKTRNLCDDPDFNFSSSESKKCITMITNFTCEQCNQTFVNRVNYLVSCKYLQLSHLLNNNDNLKEYLHQSNICEEIINKLSNCKSTSSSSSSSSIIDVQNNNKHSIYSYSSSSVININKKFLFTILPICYQVALCYINNNLKIDNVKCDHESNFINNHYQNEQHFNLTLENNIENDLQTEKSLKIKCTDVNSSIDENIIKHKNILETETDENIEIIDDKKTAHIKNNNNNEQIHKIPESSTSSSILSSSSTTTEQQQQQQQQQIDVENDGIQNTENINIFNLVDKIKIETDPIPTTTEKQNTIQQENLNTSSLSSSSDDDDRNDKLDEIIKSKDDNIYKILSGEPPASTENMMPSGSGGSGGSSSESQIVQKVQSESIFIRLSNRIKALERNMSLSGQYLEELSRRYKKQVEELQYSFSKTLTAIEEQNRNANERENSLAQQNENLKTSVNELTIRLNTCISLVGCLIPLIILQFILLWFYNRWYRYQFAKIVQNNEDKRAIKKTKKLNRRKSVESIVEQTIPAKKPRRPSEEAMRITGSYKDLLILDNQETKDKEFSNVTNTSQLNGNNSKNNRRIMKQRQRKTSVFYGKTKNSILNPIKSNQMQTSNKFEQQQQQQLKSVSEDLTANLSGSIVSSMATINSTLPPDEKLILDEDYESYVPGTDLAYNEFMPDGPSGEKNRQYSTTTTTIDSSTTTTSGSSILNVKQQKKSTTAAKLRKSPKFLKFTKYDNSSSKKSPHGPTGWEWYRLNKTSSPDINNRKLLNNIEINKKFSLPTLSPPPVIRLENNNFNGFLSSSTNSSSSISEMLRTTTTTTATINSKESLDSMKSSPDSHSPATTISNSSHLKNGNSSNKQSSFRKILKKVF